MNLFLSTPRRRNVKNGVFTLKKHRKFSVHTAQEVKRNVTAHPCSYPPTQTVLGLSRSWGGTRDKPKNVLRELVIDENSGRETTRLSHCFRKVSFSMFSVHTVTQSLLFSNSSGLKSVFEKLCFRDGLVWTVGQK